MRRISNIWWIEWPGKNEGAVSRTIPRLTKSVNRKGLQGEKAAGE